MTSRAKVAVITRTKNRNLLLVRALESVLNQTETDWVHVIVNDGGDAKAVDDLLEGYRERYGDRLMIIHHEQSKGMEAASNAGIKASESEYVVIHDDDDSWQPTFLERCLNELANNKFPTIRGAVTQITQIFERIDGDNIKEERRQDFNENLVAVTLPEITEVNKFMPISFLFERSVFEEIGYFDETLPVIGDWEFNIRFLLKYDVIVVKEMLANYYIRTNSPSNYSNTVTAGQDAHAFYRAMIINKMTRSEIEKGNITLGQLFMYGDYFGRTGNNVWRLTRILDKIKTLPFINFIRKILGK